jgi:hypothetical protein
MFLRCVSAVVALTLVLLTTSECLADSVVLKDGATYEGRLANRGFYFEGQIPEVYVGILVVDPDTDEEALVRIRTEDVDYIVLGEGLDAQYLDPNALEMRSPEQETTQRPKRFRDSDDFDGRIGSSNGTSIGLIVMGLVAVGFGVINKFGGPEVQNDGGSRIYRGDSYNTANYAFMLGGAALTLGGVMRLIRDRQAPNLPELMDQDRLMRIAWVLRF